MAEHRTSNVEGRRLKVESRMFIAEHWMSLAIADSCREVQTNVGCSRQMSHLRGNMRWRFWWQLTVVTVANELVENQQNMCHFDNYQLLYKRRGIHVLLIFHKFVGDSCHRRLSSKPSLHVTPQVWHLSRTSDIRLDFTATVGDCEQHSMFGDKHSTFNFQPQWKIIRRGSKNIERNQRVDWVRATLILFAKLALNFIQINELLVTSMLFSLYLLVDTNCLQ